MYIALLLYIYFYIYMYMKPQRVASFVHLAWLGQERREDQFEPDDQVTSKPGVLANWHSLPHQPPFIAWTNHLWAWQTQHPSV